MANAKSDLVNFNQIHLVPPEIWESMGLILLTLNPSLLASVRWGLRTGRAMTRKELGARRRSHFELAAELETAPEQIGAQWLASEPVYERVVYHVDPRSYAGVWEGDQRHTGDHRFDLVEFLPALEDPLEAETDDDFAWAEDWESLTPESEAERLDGLVPPTGLKDHFEEDNKFLILLDLVRTFPHEANVHLRPILLEAGQEATAWDGKPLFPIVPTNTTTVDLLWLTVNALVGDRVLAGWDRERLQKLHADRPQKPPAPPPPREREEKSKDKSKKPQTSTSAEPSREPHRPRPPAPGPSAAELWRAYNDLITKGLRLMRAALGNRAPAPAWPTAKRARQIEDLEAWATEDDLSRREAFLRPWRVIAIREACRLQDTGCAGEHEHPTHIGWLSHRAESTFAASGVDPDAIRRLLEGHPDADVRDRVDAFNDGFTVANSAPVKANPLAGKSMLDLAREAAERRRRRGY